MKPLEPIMHFRLIAPFATVLALLAGCAATITQDGLEQRTAQAIGRSVGQFSITDRSEETGGRINYTVNTGFQKAMSFGQIPHSDAICTAMAGGKGGSGPQGPAATGQKGRSTGGECNALLRAAGRCGTVAPSSEAR
jgi:hypothetical protein